MDPRTPKRPHEIDWERAETGVYPCQACDFSHDSPEAWEKHRIAFSADSRTPKSRERLRDLLVEALYRETIESCSPGALEARREDAEREIDAMKANLPILLAAIGERRALAAGRSYVAAKDEVIASWQHIANDLRIRANIAEAAYTELRALVETFDLTVVDEERINAFLDRGAV